MDETNYFGPVKVEHSTQHHYHNDYFGDQQPSYFTTESYEQYLTTESASSNNYWSLTSTPKTLSSSETTSTTILPTHATQSILKQEEPYQNSLLNGKIAVLKLERIDPTKYIPSQTNPTKISSRYNLRKTTSLKNVPKPEIINNFLSSDVDIDHTDNDDNCSANTTDSERESPKFQRKARGFVESFPLIEKLKIPKFHGNFHCLFCSTSKEYASELAVHEALQHSKTTTYKRTPKPGQHSKRRHRHHCPRCPYTASRRHYYVIHHLKEHLGFSDAKLLNMRPTSTTTTTTAQSKPVEPCEICQMAIPIKPHAKYNHFKTYHDLTQLKPGETSQNCLLCPAYFLRGIHLLKHQQNFHSSAVITSKNKKSHPCKNCPQKFHSLRKLWTHRRNECEMRHTFNWIATCKMEGCSPEEKFESTAELDYHVTHYHHGHKFKGEPRVCPYCGRVCIGEIGLRRHMEIHNEEDDDGNILDSDDWKCKLCPGKTFKSRIMFKKHLKCHKGKTSKGRNHMCDKCGKTFQIKSLLDIHYEFHKDPDNWKWKCEICGKKCSTKQSLQVHQRTHTGEKPFSCEICKEKFAYRHVLRWHVTKKHKEDDKPRKYTKNSLGPEGNHQARPKDPSNLEFWCEKCSKSFASKQALQIHARVHTGEMPFQCEVCEERFRYRHILRVHVNQKHGKDGILDLPRNYQKERLKKEDVKMLLEFRCGTCSKCFASKQALQIHTRVHTGEKPFCCEVCGERFRYRHILRGHVNTKHEQDGIQDLPRPYNKQSDSV